MSKYLELLAKAIGMPKPIERSRYELEKHESFLAEDGGRPMDSTSTESSSKEETEEAEPKEKNFRLECTCGSWGHPCEDVEHDCPTKCLVYIDMHSFGDTIHKNWVRDNPDLLRTSSHKFSIHTGEDSV